MLCSTKNEKWILKEFSSISKLNTQIKLTEKLIHHEFPYSYRFHPVHAFGQIIYNQKVYGLIEYIENQNKKFSYRSHEYRKQALQLLKKYHSVTATFKKDFEKDLPVFNQIDKWQDRLMEFKENEKLIRKWLPKDYFNTFLKWSEWSLQLMIKNKDYYNREPHCIIHGDVAHHNFILSNNALFIIDFDLVKISPPLIDDLQFCNRILPHLDWSLEKLLKLEPLDQYKNAIPFLIALIYPTDLLREWNHFVQYDKRSKISSFLSEITFDEFKHREKFTKEVISQLT